VGAQRYWSASWSAYLLNSSGLFRNSTLAPSTYATGDAPPRFIGAAPFDPAAPPVVTSLITKAAFVPGAAAIGCDAALGALFPAALTGRGSLSASPSDGYLFLGPTGVHRAFHTQRGASEPAPWSSSSGYCVRAVVAAAQTLTLAAVSVAAAPAASTAAR
jgi:hypothetical protein